MQQCNRDSKFNVVTPTNHPIWKRMLIICCILISVFACKVVCQSKNPGLSNHFLEDNNSKEQVELTHPQMQNLNNSNARFYPIGWSEDGKFAYVTESTNSFACDGLPTYLIIYDTKIDSIIYSYLNSCPNQFWREDYVTQKDTLVKYGIKKSNVMKVCIHEEISITNEYEAFNKKQNTKRKINHVDGYRDPDFMEYLGTNFDNNNTYGVNIILVSESESEVILTSSYY